MQILRSGMQLFSARATGSLVTFAGLIYFARVIDPSTLGSFFLFQALIGVLTIPANLGIRLAVEKRISEGYHSNHYFTTGLVVKLGLLVVVSIVLLSVRETISAYIGADLVWHLIAALSLREIANLLIGAIRGDLRVSDTAILQLAYPVTWVGLGAVFTTVGYGLYALATAVVLAYGIQLLGGVWQSSVQLARPQLEFAVSLFSYGMYSIVTSVEGEAHNWLDILLIGVFMTPAAVAAYEIAWRISSSLLTLIQAIGETIFPQISAWSEEDRISRLSNLIRDAMSPAFLLTIPAAAGAWLLNEEILQIVFGDEYLIAATALVIIIIGKTPRAIREVVGKGLLGIDRPDLLMYAAVVDILSNFTLNVVLIQYLGLPGAALATTISLTIGAVIRGWLLSRHVPFTIDYRIVTWAIGGSIAMTLVIGAVLSRVAITTPIALTIAICTAMLIYFGVVLSNSEIRTKIIDTIW